MKPDEIKAKYTNVVPTSKDTFEIHLRIDHQYFVLATPSNEETCLWYQEQLTKALSRMILDCQKTETKETLQK